MKVYGYDDTGPARGELIAAEIAARDLDFGLDALAGELGWEYVATAFCEAKQALVAKMCADGADEELIRMVRGMKASYVPVVEEL